MYFQDKQKLPQETLFGPNFLTKRAFMMVNHCQVDEAENSREPKRLKAANSAENLLTHYYL